MIGVVLLLLLGRSALGLPTLEDNKIPTDEEIAAHFGQPEEISPLNLPTDEESFNQLKIMLSSVPSSSSGTYHFVSSTFPEVDARGFHESVFDGIGDYFPSWPVNYKRGNSRPPPTLAQRLGLRPHSYRKRSQSARGPFWYPEPSVIRRKRESSKSLLTEKKLNSTDDYENNTFPGKSSHKTGTQRDLSVNNKHSSESEYYGYSRPTKREVRSNIDYPGEDGSDVLQSVEEKSADNSKNSKRSSARYIRGMEMGSSGFHGDVFNGDFGDFTTMKRKRARGSLGFHSDTFSDGFGDFQTMKRFDHNEDILDNLGIDLNKIENHRDERIIKTPSKSGQNEIDSVNDNTYSGSISELDNLNKRRPEMDSMGFHGDTFSRGFGDFEPFKKRRPEMDSMGFHGDTFSRGFGDFEPLKKRRPEMDSMGFHGDTFSRGFGDFEPLKKRRPEMDSMGFHGDTFNRGFGDFEPLKKRRPEMDSMGFHGDTFSRGFGDFEPLKKRRPEMDSMGFHGDTFSRGFGDFEPLKKRRPEMDSMGFHGDTFSRGFGDFEPLKKRRPEMDSMGFHGDTFSRGFGDFEPLKKRRPEMDSMGFHGDTFSRGFGDFEPLKKRRPEMDSMGFHGDTFSRGFGDFEPLKKRRPEMDSMGFHGDTFSTGFGDFETLKKRSIDYEELNKYIERDTNDNIHKYYIKGQNKLNKGKSDLNLARLRSDISKYVFGERKQDEFDCSDSRCQRHL